MTYSFNQFAREIKELGIVVLDEKERKEKIKELFMRMLEENPEEAKRMLIIPGSPKVIRFADLLNKDMDSEEWKAFLESLML